MITVIVTEKGGEPRRLTFDDNIGELKIGRVQGNEIILPKTNVSKMHAKIVVRNGEFTIFDNQSTNGTYVDGRRITAPKQITGANKVFIGEFMIYIEDGSGIPHSMDDMPATGAPPPRQAPPPPPAGGRPPQRNAPPPPPIRGGASDLDDDLFPAMDDGFGSAPPPPRSRPAPPPAGGFDDDLFGNDDLGLDAPPARPAPGGPPPRRPAPTPIQQSPLLDDDLGLDAPAPTRPAPPARPAPGGPPPRRPAPPALEDDLGLEEPAYQAPAPPARQAPPPAQAAPPPAYQAPAPQAAPPPAYQQPYQQQQAYQAPPAAQAAPPPAYQAPPPAQAAPPPAYQAPPAAQAAPPQHQHAPAQPKQAPKPSGGPAKNKKGGIDPKLEKISLVQKKIHDRLIEKMDLRRMNLDEIPEEELWDRTDAIICEIVDQMASAGELPSFVDQDELIKDVLNEALGLGPLQDFLEDDSISEIMVNHSTQIYVERSGKLTLSEKIFSSDQAVLGVIERIVAPIGRRIDESSPLVDARLKDGSRVNAIIPPLALKGPCITIRKFKRDVLGIDELIKFNTLTRGMGDFIKMCVIARKNIIISGGTGSGKTTTLNIISNFIPEGERIITIEDAAELQIQKLHWIQLESRPPNIEGKGAITIRELMKNTLRMRPDRIVVGECRGGEALDMLQAMNTGHDGSLTTIHANTPRDVLSRLETMVLMSGMDLPVRAIREQIASAVDIIVQQTRYSDGSRKITYITEVTGMEGEIITMQDIFNFRQEGYDAENKVLGKYVATGFMPKFYDDLRRKGIPVDMSIFREQ
ncbi:Flp pilus assembly complex ATPase component TadA [Myxococcota bacterium]|nr:Flp pilus assembly complex ATPase component TadA [Myxococcota bacterium]MBU1382383.1 Flp pilus assembly complex ATPase component TadA [Myxococcota bacterium]MBU1499195.1 Flp pilus assembly complex ATPase component TadA [Myxococcota bacterium]